MMGIWLQHLKIFCWTQPNVTPDSLGCEHEKLKVSGDSEMVLISWSKLGSCKAQTASAARSSAATNMAGVQPQAWRLVQPWWVSGSARGPGLSVPTASLALRSRLPIAKWCCLGFLYKALLPPCVGCPRWSASFFIYLKWPSGFLSRDCSRQTEFGFKQSGVWDGGHHLLAVCWAETLQVFGFFVFFSALEFFWDVPVGRQQMANEAFQVGCGDRVLSSLKQSPCHGCLICYPPQFFQGGFFWIWRIWMEARKLKPCFEKSKGATLNLFDQEETKIRHLKSFWIRIISFCLRILLYISELCFLFLRTYTFDHRHLWHHCFDSVVE